MSHSIYNILSSPSHPFHPGAPPEIASLVRDAHLTGLKGAFCVSVVTGNRIFLSLEGVGLDDSPVGLYASFNPGSEWVRVFDLEQAVRGWLLIQTANLPTTPWKGRAEFLPGVCVPLEWGGGGQVPAIEGSGSLRVSHDTSSNQILLSYNENDFLQYEEVSLPEVTSKTDVGIFTLEGVRGPGVTLEGEGFTVHKDLELGHWILVPDLVVELGNDTVEISCVGISPVDMAGHEYRFFREDGTDTLEVIVTDSTNIGERMVFAAEDDKGNSWDGVEGILLEGSGAKPSLRITQRWGGCDEEDILVRLLTCSSTDGSTTAYPLDNFSCPSGETCPPVWKDTIEEPP